MTSLDLSANQGISGTIPASFSVTPEICPRYIRDMPEMHLSWSFSRQVMRKLRDFRLNRNNLLSGTLSDQIIAGMTSVTLIDLSRNDLSGTLPTAGLMSGSAGLKVVHDDA